MNAPVWNMKQIEDSVDHLFSKYDEARMRSNRAANMFGEVSDLADRLEAAAEEGSADSELQAEWNRMCFRIGHA